MAKVKRKLTEKQLKNLKQNKDGIKPPTYPKRKDPPVRLVDPDEEETEEETRRRNWIFNNTLVTAEYTRVMVDKKRLPTTAELARATGLSPRTIERHLEEFDYMKVLETFKSGLDPVMMNLFKQAATGRSEKMIRLFLDAIGITNKNRLDITTGGKPLPAPAPPLHGVVTLDPKTLPTEFLEKLIAEHESNNS